MGREKEQNLMGAQAMDHEKIATAAVQGMKAANLNRFLVVCALVSDLYCPGYNPRQSLEKNSNLARTAIRYKIDTAKVAVSVRAELTKRKETQASASKNKKLPSATLPERELSKAKPAKQK
jgi:hypothetical protein